MSVLDHAFISTFLVAFLAPGATLGLCAGGCISPGVRAQGVALFALWGDLSDMSIYSRRLGTRTWRLPAYGGPGSRAKVVCGTRACDL